MPFKAAISLTRKRLLLGLGISRSPHCRTASLCIFVCRRERSGNILFEDFMQGPDPVPARLPEALQLRKTGRSSDRPIQYHHLRKCVSGYSRTLSPALSNALTVTPENSTAHRLAELEHFRIQRTSPMPAPAPHAFLSVSPTPCR